MSPHQIIGGLGRLVLGCRPVQLVPFLASRLFWATKPILPTPLCNGKSKLSIKLSRCEREDQEREGLVLDLNWDGQKRRMRCVFLCFRLLRSQTSHDVCAKAARWHASEPLNQTPSPRCGSRPPRPQRLFLEYESSLSHNAQRLKREANSMLGTCI